MKYKSNGMLEMFMLVGIKGVKVLQEQFDNNLPPILPQLSINLPHSPRSYAGFSDFRSKKVKKVCDNNLTHAGYGAICVEKSLPGLD